MDPLSNLAEFFQNSSAIVLLSKNVSKRYETVIGVPCFGAKATTERSINSLIRTLDEDSLIIVSLENYSEDAASVLVAKLSENIQQTINSCGLVVVFHKKIMRLINHWNFLIDCALKIDGIVFFAWGSDHDIWHLDWYKETKSLLVSNEKSILAIPNISIASPSGELSRLRVPRRSRSRSAIIQLLGVYSPGNLVYGLFRIEVFRKGLRLNQVLLPDRLLITVVALCHPILYMDSSRETLWIRIDQRYPQSITKSQRQRILLGRYYRFASYIPWPIVHLVTALRYFGLIRRWSETPYYKLFLILIKFEFQSIVALILKKFVRAKRNLSKYFQILIFKLRKSEKELCINFGNLNLTGKVIILALRTARHLPYVETVVTELIDRNFQVKMMVHTGASEEIEKFIQSLGLKYRDGIQISLPRKRNGSWVSIQSIFEFLLNLRSSDLMTLKERLRIYPWDPKLSFKSIPNRRLVTLLSLFELASKAPTHMLFFALKLSEFKFTRYTNSQLDQLEAQFVLAVPGNMRGCTERSWLRVSKQRRIPTAIMCLSWDNPTTKGVFLEKPDIIFAQSEFQRGAILAQGFFTHTVQVVGSTQFESWVKVKQELILESKSANYIVYLGSSLRTAVNQDFYLNQIIEMLESAADSQLCLIIRPHPSLAISNDVIDRIRGNKRIQVVESELQATQKDRVYFGEFLVSARAIFGEATSALLVSRIFGAQTFLMNFEGQVQPGERHLKALIDSNYFHTITNSVGLAKVMAKLVSNSSVDTHRLNGPWHPQVVSDSSLTSTKIVDYIEDAVKLNNEGNTSVH